MFKWTKKLCAVALCGVMAVSLAACGSNEAPVDSAAKEPASVDSATVEQPSDETIRVGVLSIADSLPIFAAEQEGMFEAAGLNVEVYPFKSSADQSKAVEAGELDIVMNDMIVQSLMKGFPSPRRA